MKSWVTFDGPWLEFACTGWGSWSGFIGGLAVAVAAAAAMSTLPWFTLNIFAAVVLLYLAINALFAIAYLVAPDWVTQHNPFSPMAGKGGPSNVRW